MDNCASNKSERVCQTIICHIMKSIVSLHLKIWRRHFYSFLNMFSPGQSCLLSCISDTKVNMQAHQIYSLGPPLVVVLGLLSFVAIPWLAANVCTLSGIFVPSIVFSCLFRTLARWVTGFALVSRFLKWFSPILSWCYYESCSLQCMAIFGIIYKCHCHDSTLFIYCMVWI